MTGASPIAAISNGWREFWFRPEPMYTLGLVRIVYGTVAVAWTLSLMPDLYDFFGNDGISHHGDVGHYRWSIFEMCTSDEVLLIGWLVLLLAAIALTVGWNTRLAAILVFVLVVSFDRRTPSVFNSGDMLVRVESLFIALSPCGTALSLDQRRRTGDFWSAQIRAPWSIRLMQCQLSLIYLATVRAKLSGTTWPNGTAVSYALQLWDMQLLPVPNFIKTNALLMNLATWGTLVVESTLPILVWVRRLRPWALGAGVLLHLGILLTMSVGFFTPAMLVLYVAFIPPETARRLVDKVRRPAARRTRSLPKRDADTSDSGSVDASLGARPVANPQ
jgi:Vitamin K-dependent gamma-carboxylase